MLVGSQTSGNGWPTVIVALTSLTWTSHCAGRKSKPTLSNAYFTI